MRLNFRIGLSNVAFFFFDKFLRSRVVWERVSGHRPPVIDFFRFFGEKIGVLKSRKTERERERTSINHIMQIVQPEGAKVWILMGIECVWARCNNEARCQWLCHCSARLVHSDAKEGREAFSIASTCSFYLRTIPTIDEALFCSILYSRVRVWWKFLEALIERSNSELSAGCRKIYIWLTKIYKWSKIVCIVLYVIEARRSCLKH